MAEIKEVWGVRNPTPDSEMGDVCFKLRVPTELGNYILGTGGPTFAREEHKFYTDESSARKDAEARMKARDKRKKATDGEIALRVARKQR